MRIIIFSIFVFTFLYESSFAGNKIGVGPGVITCYEFLHPTKGYEGRGRDDSFLYWAQGYMTSKNIYSETNIHLSTIDIDEQIVIMKVYCEEHKRDRVYDAVEFLYNELYKKGKQEK